MASLLNHLVRPEGECRRYVETNRLGGFEVDHEHEFRRLLDRNVAWRNAVENLADLIRPATEIVWIIWRIRQKYPLAFGKVRPPSNRWQAMFHHQFEYQLSVFGVGGKPVGHKRFNLLLRHRLEGLPIFRFPRRT